MNLVVGATGRLGSEICRRLTAVGKPVRALVRATSDQAKVDRLSGYGVELVQGDLRDPASLATACRGVDAVITTTSAMPASYDPEGNNIQSVDIEGLSSLIAARGLLVWDASSIPRSQAGSTSTFRSGTPSGWWRGA